MASPSLLFAGAVALFPYLGTSFIPEMKEGSVSPNIHRVPNISLDESIKMEMEAMRVVMGVPGVTKVVSRLGRGGSPADPVSPDEAEVIATLAPRDQMPKGLDAGDDCRRRFANDCQYVPGVNLVIAQPISDRVDEMVTGVRADVAVKLFGDDLNVLIEKANEIARVAQSVRGLRDFRVDRVGGQQYLNVVIDRQAIARQGLNASDVHDVIETAIGGKVVDRDLRGRAPLPGGRAVSRGSFATASRRFARIQLEAPRRGPACCSRTWRGSRWSKGRP